MAIERRTVPYEFLVRFNADGTTKGQHIKYLDQLVDTDTGEVLSEQEGEAKPVGDAANQVPLNTALNRVAAQLAIAEERERTIRAQAVAARDQALAARKAARDALVAAHAALQAALDQQ